MTPPAGVPWTCPVLDRLARLCRRMEEPDRTAALCHIEILRSWHVDLRSAAETRSPRDRAAIDARIEVLLARLPSEVP